VFDTLKEILVSKLKVNPDLINPEATRDDINMDSIAIVELSLILAQDLNIEINDDDLFKTSTLGDIVQLMEERRPRSDAQL
jgi:acyl carrier protein